MAVVFVTASVGTKLAKCELTPNTNGGVTQELSGTISFQQVRKN